MSAQADWIRAFDWVRRCMIEYPDIQCTAMIGNTRMSYTRLGGHPLVKIYLVAEEKE